MRVLSSKLLGGKRSHNSSSPSSFVSDSSAFDAASVRETGFAHVGTDSVDLKQSLGRVVVSHAGYQANDPFQDLHTQVVDDSHVFLALFTSRHALQGASYLQRHLHRELLRHMTAGDIPKTFRAALAAVDRNFRHLHPFNSSIMDGIEAATVWIDLLTATAYIAHTGACRVVIGGWDMEDTVKVALDTAEGAGKERRRSGLGRHVGPEASYLESMRSLQLDEGMDTVLVGSSGFWREVYPEKALLRLCHYSKLTPQSDRVTAAGHLINLALHSVVSRMQQQVDPRMSALKSVSSLQSLHVGDISKYKWGGRQPVRRRRGDVHGDMSLLAVRLHWAGDEVDPLPADSSAPSSLRGAAKRIRQSLSKGNLVTLSKSSARERALRHWDLLRLHFLNFPIASRRSVEKRWFGLVQALKQQAQDEGDRVAAATALLRGPERASFREALHRRNSGLRSALESPIFSRLLRSTSLCGSGPSRSQSETSSSSLGVDSDAESPDSQPISPVKGNNRPRLFGAKGGDHVEEELSDLRSAAHPLRTTTYRIISLDRVLAVPAAA